MASASERRRVELQQADRIRELEAEVSAHESAYEAIQADEQKHLARIADLEATVERWKTIQAEEAGEAARFRGELETEVERLRFSETKLNEMVNNRDTLVRTVEAERDNLRELLVEEVQAAEKIIVALREKLEAAESRNAYLEDFDKTELHDLCVRHVALREKLEAAERERDALQKEFDDLMQSLP